MSLVEKTLRKLQGSMPRAVPVEPAARAAAEGSVAVSASAAARSSADLERTGRVVRIDPTALRTAGLMAPEPEERLIAQQFRHIKRPLIAAALGRGEPRPVNGRLIMVASAIPGEGKTFTAVNLALSMSLEKDLRVVLVDADVAKPNVSRTLGLEAAAGLLDVLRNPLLDPESLLVQTDVANLSVMPAGAASSDHTELLASARMEQVVKMLSQRDERRIILLDSPPLLHTTESHSLLPLCGQVVVIVRAGMTPQHVLMDALACLQEHPAVSLVLNESELSGQSAYYYSGYGDRDTAAKPA